MASKEYLKFFEELRSREIPKDMSIQETRKNFDALMEQFPFPEDIKIEPFKIGPIQAYWLTPAEVEKQPVLLYFHGGGYVAGSFLTHGAHLAQLVKKANMRALFFEYRLAPEHPYPMGLEDAMTVYKWLLHHPFPHNQIAFAGDSAGGGLLLSLMLKLKLNREPLPKAAYCNCPWVDLAKTKYAERMEFAKDFLLIEAAKMYVGKHDPKEPYISPIYGDLSELPPILIQTGEEELLYEEILELSKKIPRAKLKIWPEMFHCWSLFPLYPEAELGIQEAANFLKSSFQSQ